MCSVSERSLSVCGEAGCGLPCSVLIDKASISCYYQPLTLCQSDNINNNALLHDQTHLAGGLFSSSVESPSLQKVSIRLAGSAFLRDLN